MKRSGKFYRRNEAEIMELLGFKPTPNSGSGWVVKEDGISEDCLCQLKSTDASSIKVCKKDIDTLLYNANVAHKLPVFAIQFLQSNEVYLVIRPEDLQEAAKYIKTGEYTTNEEFVGVDINSLEDETPEIKCKVKSSESAREKYTREWLSKFEKKRKNAK
jgi:Holliday junction resolvase